MDPGSETYTTFPAWYDTGSGRAQLLNPSIFRWVLYACFTFLKSALLLFLTESYMRWPPPCDSLWQICRMVSNHPSLHLLWQSRYSLNTDAPSSTDLTCFAIENTSLLPHLKQVYNDFSKVYCDFSSCSMARFTFSLSESKIGWLKTRSIFFQHFFLWPLK